MEHTTDIALQDLLPIHFEGGFKLEALSDDCATCGEAINEPEWRAEIGWIAPASCVIALSASCPGCTTDQTRRIRIRAQPDGWASIDWLVDGAWQSAVIGNITWTERLRRKFGI